MATATEMTLALGRTVYGGDQSGEIDSDEKIEGRETRLSVTWRLTEEEQDLTLMVSVLAEEAERALRQADRTIRKGPSPGECSSTEEVTRIENGPKSAANTERLAAEQQPVIGEQQPASGERQTTTGASAEVAQSGNGNGSGHGTASGGQPTSSYAPASSYQTTSDQNGSQAHNGGQSPAGSNVSKLPDYVPPITKTQQLAIKSHCARHGVADWELRRLLWEMFRKKEMLELRRNQAGELLMALQQTTAGETAEYAN